MLLYLDCLAHEQVRAFLFGRVEQIFPVPAQQCVRLFIVFLDVLQILGNFLVLSRCSITHNDLRFILALTHHVLRVDVVVIVAQNNAVCTHRLPVDLQCGA